MFADVSHKVSAINQANSTDVAAFSQRVGLHGRLEVVLLAGQHEHVDVAAFETSHWAVFALFWKPQEFWLLVEVGLDHRLSNRLHRELLGIAQRVPDQKIECRVHRNLCRRRANGSQPEELDQGVCIACLLAGMGLLQTGQRIR